jgi:hypothetical protein
MVAPRSTPLIDELLDDEGVESLRRLGGTGRLRMLDELCAAGRALMVARCRDQHPDWPDHLVQAEVSRRIRDAVD